MCNCVGGDDYINRLLAPLELLAAVEESAVRDMTLRSIEIVVNRMSDEHIGKFFIPFLSRLSSKDWFTSRISAASLFHIVYNRLSETEKCRVRSLFHRLCSDDTPSVRRAAAVNFSALMNLMKPFEVFDEFIGTFNSIAKDEQDSVRIQVITICISLATILDSEQQASQILPVVIAIGGDRSWRVRWSLACRLHELCKPLGSQVSNSHLSSVFESLLNDSEAEVRSAAAGRLALICSFLRKGTIVSRVIPAVQRLVTDSSEHVRASLASVVNGLATSLGKEDTVERLLPILLLLLRDEVSEVRSHPNKYSSSFYRLICSTSISPQVRLNIISNLDAMNSVVSVDLLSQSLLPAIVDLAEDGKWRVRLAIIELIPILAKHLGKEYFGDKLSALCMAWLDDGVHSIRRAATENLMQLTELFGEEWAVELIIPRIGRMQMHQNYLHRTTALYVLQVVVRCLSLTAINKKVLPIIILMAADPVPNIRFITAKTIQLVYMRCQAIRASSSSLKASNASLYTATAEELSSVLSKLLQDPDRDVKFYAALAMKVASKASSPVSALKIVGKT